MTLMDRKVLYETQPQPNFKNTLLGPIAMPQSKKTACESAWKCVKSTSEKQIFTDLSVFESHVKLL